MKSVLVTGALGVIGTHLTRLLATEGYEVIGSDIQIRDYSDYVRADVTSFEDLHRLGSRHDIDLVIHMAGEVGRLVGEAHPQRMVYVNDVGVLNVIQFCLERDARLIYFSTSEVYGRLLDRGDPVEEDEIADGASAFATTNVYALSKLFGEALVRHYVDNYGLDAVTVRPFMVYGPGERPSAWRSAICNFVHAARHNQPITVHENTVRSWCYIDDFVRGVELLARQPRSGRYEAYNVGADEYISMEEVARTICDELEASAEIIEIVPPPDRFLSPTKIASIAKMQSLGYAPKVPLREGVRAVADWQARAGL